MKLGTKTAILSVVITLGVLISLAGFAKSGTHWYSKTGNQRSVKTGNTMEAVEKDYRQALAQIDATGASLQDLVRPGQRDVKKAFRKYSADVNQMEDLGKRLLEHGDKMSAQGKDYFVEWEKQGDEYTNPQIQALSEQRRADLSAYFVKISEASVGVKGASKAYLSDIREIQTYLSNDLTPKGIESITPVSQKAVKDGNDLKQAVAPVVSAIGSVRSELAPGGTKK
jgi:hypothetical protein